MKAKLLGRLVDAFEELPGTYRGVSYGRPMKVIARRGETRLAWCPGHSSYISRMSPPAYAAATLYLFRPDDRHGLAKTLQDGGRLSLKLIRSLYAEIDAVFGEGAAEAITLKGTAVFK
jgi:hypothetical protein